MIPIDSKLYIDDLDRTIESTSVLENLKDSALFITGGTGLILSALVDLICRYNSTQKGNIVIYVAGRSESGVRARFGAFSSYDYFRDEKRCSLCFFERSIRNEIQCGSV